MRRLAPLGASSPARHARRRAASRPRRARRRASSRSRRAPSRRRRRPSRANAFCRRRRRAPRPPPLPGSARCRASGAAEADQPIGAGERTLEEIVRDTLAAAAAGLARRTLPGDRRAAGRRGDRARRRRGGAALKPRGNAVRPADGRAAPARLPRCRLLIPNASARNGSAMLDKTYRAGRGGAALLRAVGSLRRVRRRPRQRQAALYDHDAAAERHRQPAYGPRADLHLAGCAGPLSAHARARRAVAARHRSCRHRHRDRRRPTSSPSGRSTSARSAASKFVERVWEWKAESGGTIVDQLRRLGASPDWRARALHDGPGPGRRGAPGVRPALPRGARSTATSGWSIGTRRCTR